MASTSDNAGASSRRKQPQAQAQAAPKMHPFKDSTSLLEVLPDIDVEEEVRTYEDMCDVSTSRISFLILRRSGLYIVPPS